VSFEFSLEVNFIFSPLVLRRSGTQILLE